MTDSLVPVFDGHNDVLLRLFKETEPGCEQRFLAGLEGGHLDLPRMRAGGMVGGLFAIFVPSPGPGPDDQPRLPTMEEAQAATLKMASILLRIEKASAGQVRICRDVAAIRSAIADGAVATVMHIEGAEAIDPEFHMLEVLQAAGLRSIGPVWSRPNIFGDGVPFKFPSSPDTGAGLTDLGKELIRQCNARRIMIDLSHINEQGFWDVAAISDAPLVASHSNVHAWSPSSRNLTDRQLAAVRERRGLVGLNFATGFLRADGKMTADTEIEVMIRHLDALLEAVGEDGVAIGSDFDGATIPQPIGDVAGLPNLITAMLEHQYGEALVRKIAAENWLSLLERTWAP